MQLRPATLSDRSQVISLMRRLGMSPPSERRWTELWTANPAYREEVPIGWVIDPGESLAGFIGNLPRQMWDGSREIVARVPTSWSVEPRARAYSLPLLSRWLNQPDAALLLDTTATPEAAALLDKLRLARVPCPALGHRAVWIASYSGAAAGALRRVGLGALSFLGAAAAPIDWLVRAAAGSPTHALEWRTSIGADFDRLWARLATRPVLQSRRDAANLAWAYGEGLSDGQAWLLARPDGDGVSGYAVFRRYPIPTMGLVRMRLVDFAALDDDPVPYLNAALARCRREGMAVLESTGLDQRLDDALARAGPLRAKIEGWPGFWRTGDAALAGRLAKPESWYPSPYDGDSSLW